MAPDQGEAGSSMASSSIKPMATREVNDFTSSGVIDDLEGQLGVMIQKPWGVVYRRGGLESRHPKDPSKYPGFPVRKPEETALDFEDRILKFWKQWRRNGEWAHKAAKKAAVMNAAKKRSLDKSTSSTSSSTSSST